MRVRFEHAAATREMADPVLVQVEATGPAGDACGWGETLARPYVTGETAESVCRAIERVFAPRIEQSSFSSFAETVEFADSLPMVDGAQCLHAARCAVELALLDLSGRAFGRRAAEAAAYLELRGFGPPGALAAARYSGIAIGRGRKLEWMLRAQRCYGLRDFKIKVAIPDWQTKLEATHRTLKGAIAAERATLRADANGGWSLEEAIDALPMLAACGVSALEQPLPRERDADLPRLAQAAEAAGVDLIADESLVTEDDARRLIAAGVRVLNIRLAKNGGLLAAWRLAALALAGGCDVQLGCLVGETSILTAAGQAFLESCPTARFVEGAFGSFLLRDDVVRRPLRFGYGGRLAPLRPAGLGVEVDPARPARLAKWSDAKH